MHNVTNPLQACNDIFFRPNGVFNAINEKSNWSWLPFLIVVIMAILPNYLYISVIDISWYQDLVINAQYGQLSPAEMEAQKQNMTRTSMTAFTVIGTFVGLIVINAIVAAYLNIATRGDEDNANGYTDWYGFTWWAGMPIVISALIAVVLLVLSDGGQLNPSIVLPLSLAYWMGTEMTSDWFAFLQSIRLDSFWGIYLTTVGISQWTNFSTKKSAVIAVAPWAIIWTIWAVVILL
ncbi:Yip1 family protein [Alteromonas antoniana]|uniref:Yip1 family protein n=1 Tax=Alteromonas antoniana TaxID=2803813 RepID=UPI001C463B2A|nr:Yip1 family protein [Alteromonas antoniana]